MSRPIEDYALLSDCHSSALVDRDGSIDWLTFPCFDSAACFASILGDKENGRWTFSPKSPFTTKRRYVEDTMVLETTFKTQTGSFTLTDCMLMEDKAPTLVRSVKGLSGEVELEMELIIRFDYGSIVPWVTRNENRNGLHAVGGPDGLVLYSPYKIEGKDLHSYARFTIHAGEERSFTLMWYPSHLAIPCPLENPVRSIDRTIEKWEAWSEKCTYKGFDKEAVRRSLITLKALTYEPTGAIVAAPTTSLPENLGGVRNWDYRFGWLRDSSFTLFALIKGGYTDEAIRWEKWLHRAVAGTPSQVNIMYGIRAERRLMELELDWLSGYENSRPVRIGNGAYSQFQLDVYGEVMATSHLGRKLGIPVNQDSWRIETKMIEFVCEHWHEPDEGIWEVRGPRRHFTHSKLMAWVALNCAIDAVRLFALPGDLVHWVKLRDQIHAEICDKGFNKKINSFVQSYGSSSLDASLLMMGHVGFLPPDDPRMIGTVEAVKKHLMKDGHVYRYRTEDKVDGLPGDEGSFIACSFWLVDNLLKMGRREEALEHYRAIQSIKNDLGLYAEEYLPNKKRMVGNFPQAFSHIAEIVSAMGFDDFIKEDLCKAHRSDHQEKIIS